VLEYQTDLTKFQAVSSLTLFFPTNVASTGTTEIWYVGLRGEGTGNVRDMRVTTAYEVAFKLNSNLRHHVNTARAIPQAHDHRTPAEDGAPAPALGL